MFDWIDRFNVRQRLAWPPKWERVRSRGRTQYIWGRVVPVYVAYGVFITYFVLPMLQRSQFAFGPLLSRLSFILPVCVILGYRQGSRLWKKLEARYEEIVRERQSTAPSV